MDQELPALSRRALVSATLLSAVTGCAAPLLPLGAPGTTPDAQELLAASAAAHGIQAFSRLSDLSVSYAGQFHALVGRLQPALVDASFRGRSEERLLLHGAMVIGQTHIGAAGQKQVARRTGAGERRDIRVWYNGIETHDADARAAAALVVDDYSLFLLGPMVLASFWTRDRAVVFAVDAPVQIAVGGTTRWCDILRARMSPGLGFAQIDELALYVDRDERLVRRVRFSVNGLESTRGAVAEVDAWDHVTLHGVRWPTRFHERLLRPLPLAVHEWRLTGLDVDRGFEASDIDGPGFTGAATAPAGAK